MHKSQNNKRSYQLPKGGRGMEEGNNDKKEKIQDKKIELAQFIHDHIFQIISSVDTKASIIVAINGVILGLLFQPEVLQEIAVQKQEVGVLFTSVVILLGASAIFGLLTIYPKRRPVSTKIFPKEESGSWAFRESIADLKKSKRAEVKRECKKKDDSLKTYQESWESIDDLTKILKEEVTGVFNLKEALRHQFFRLRCSLTLLMFAVGLLVIVLLLTQLVLPNEG
jgi:hypothetical protein